MCNRTNWSQPVAKLQLLESPLLYPFLSLDLFNYLGNDWGLLNIYICISTNSSVMYISVLLSLHFSTRLLSRHGNKRAEFVICFILWYLFLWKNGHSQELERRTECSLLNLALCTVCFDQECVVCISVYEWVCFEVKYKDICHLKNSNFVNCSFIFAVLIYITFVFYCDLSQYYF